MTRLLDLMRRMKSLQKTSNNLEAGLSYTNILIVIFMSALSIKRQERNSLAIKIKRRVLMSIIAIVTYVNMAILNYPLVFL